MPPHPDTSLGQHGQASFEDISPWVRRPANPRPALRDEVRADVVVVGAGYTGLSTALSLAAAGADVVVLERDFAGAGASGRNAGHLTPTIGKDLPTLLKLFGRERAARLVRFADDAVAHTEDLIARLAIDCDYNASGNVLAAVHDSQHRKLVRAAKAAAELGAEVRFLDAGEMRDRGIPGAFLFGVLEERGGTLHPGRFVTGLRDHAVTRGVRLYENTAVTDLRDGSPVVVRTADGCVVADAAVLASNAYTPQLGWLVGKIVPLRVTLFETALMNEKQREEIAWPRREGIYTAHEVLESYHLTAAGTIVGGSKVVRFAAGNRLPPAFDRRVIAAIERAFRERFPMLSALPIKSFWGGWIALPLDFLPMLGRSGDSGSVHYALGYAGHGVAQATFMGAILAEQLAGRPHPAAAALSRRVLSWPPEPLRWLGGRALDGCLRLLDARTDFLVRKGGRRAQG